MSNSSSSENLNDDLSKRVVMRTSEMEWVKSGPSATVERKRCFRAGGQESGSVTSVVRYLPGAVFPMHPHPEGEEIFVLEGTFSDTRGDHGPGVFLLNPEGFEHAPSSTEGNLLLVRLRQYPNAVEGTIRSQMALDTNSVSWVDTDVPGIQEKCLYPLDDTQEQVYPERQWLEKWTRHTQIPPQTVGQHGLEIFVVDGSFTDTEGSYQKGDWLRLPHGYILDASSTTDGCTLLCKSGGFMFAIPSDDTK
eukprot:CAMPEP_0195296112 /NCGR_PEP_ID=MMETSP0707-20130614/18807_1 /TAXON_ID=33640 /ORGANISM="Asterionellopsis glacialis, Strain CCMP134" /LENGTH=248 /DNA_ID=CAMNT_0040357527 /DNA_START=193 /DNA_END=939 /DNA_ORIENTATION=-